MRKIAAKPEQSFSLGLMENSEPLGQKSTWYQRPVLIIDYNEFNYKAWHSKPKEDGLFFNHNSIGR